MTNTGRQTPSASPTASHSYPGMSWSEPMLPPMPVYGDVNCASADPSPMGNQMQGVYLPMEAVRNCGMPQLHPGMAGPCMVASPAHCMDNSMNAFGMSSPHAGVSPMAMQAHPMQMQVLHPHAAMPQWHYASPHGNQNQYCGFQMPHNSGMTICATQAGADGQMQFLCHMPHMHGVQQMSPQSPQAVAIHMQVPMAMNGGMPQPQVMQTQHMSPESWQGKHELPSAPFPMPLSPPHDMAQSCFSSGTQPAFFENWTPDGQPASHTGSSQ